MYKSASRAMKHAHRVDLIHPSKGYIAGVDDAPDILASIDAMSRQQLEDERARLRLETGRWTSELAGAKALGDLHRVSGIGATMATINVRAAAVCAEIKRRNIAESDLKTFEFKRLVREEVGDDRFFALLNEAEAVVRASK